MITSEVNVSLSQALETFEQSFEEISGIKRGSYISTLFEDKRKIYLWEPNSEAQSYLPRKTPSTETERALIEARDLILSKFSSSIEEQEDSIQLGNP